MTKLRTAPFALVLLAATVAIATFSIAPAAQAQAQAQAKPKPAAAAAAHAAAPTTPTVDASELQTLRITNALQDFQLNQATLTDSQNKVEPLRQAIIHSIAAAAQELHLTPDYQWDFQQKKFIKPQPAPAAAAAAAPAAPAAK